MMYNQFVVKKNLNLKHSCKLDVKNAKVELIHQHMNATCHMWSLTMNFTLVPLAPKIVNTPIYCI
jgi:Cu/Ag efflux protein CusF